LAAKPVTVPVKPIRAVQLQCARIIGREGGIGRGGAAELDGGAVVDQRRAVSGHGAMDGDIAAIGPQAAAVGDVACDVQPAAAGGFQGSGIDDDVRPGVDQQRVDAGGDDGASLTRVRLPSPIWPAPEMVLSILSASRRGRADDDIAAVIRHHDLAATLQGDAVLDQFQLAGRARE